MISATLNKKIYIEKGTSTTSSVGSPLLSYSEYITTMANVYIRSGDVRMNENEELFFTTEFTIRFNNKTKYINNKYRIKYNDQYYKIVEIYEPEDRQTIKLICVHFYDE